MKWIFLLIGLLGYNNVEAQTTFNKRMTVGCINTVFASIEVTDSCYYLVGGARDTTNCEFNLLFMKVDHNGNVLDYDIHAGVGGRYEMWRPNLQTDVDGKLLLAGDWLDSRGLHAMIYRLDTDGNLIWTRRHYNIDSTYGRATRSDDLIIASDSSYILAGQSDFGWQLTCFNRDGTVRWYNYTYCLGNFCFEQRILKENDGFVVGYYNGDINLIDVNYTVLCVLEKYDYAGNQLWRWTNDSSQQLYGANHLIKTKDGGYLIASAEGKEYFNSDGVTTRPLRDGIVFKLDSARNMVWQRPLRAYSHSYDAKISRLIELQDSTLMVFGITPDSFWHITDNTWRYQENLLVANLSADGDSLWSNQYYYFHEQKYAAHYITDVERTPDGGYLCAGQAQGSGQGAYQQGWLLKLDSMGCLVPGCRDLVNQVQQLPDPPKAKLLLYPNPAVDYLNVHYIHTGKGERLEWRILNGQGQVVQEYQSRAVSDQTYIFEVGGLLSGWYVLEVVLDGVPVGREVFVK